MSMLPQYPPSTSSSSLNEKSFGNDQQTALGDIGRSASSSSTVNKFGESISPVQETRARPSLPSPTKAHASYSSVVDGSAEDSPRIGSNSKSTFDNNSQSTKKRPRRPSDASTTKSNNPSASTNGNGGKSNGGVAKKGKNGNANTAESPPAVLVREKKQKACSNCRRAKLKCIVDEGETDCVRCKSRKERCVFYPRSHDEDWQQTLTSDVYSAINHLSTLSSAVNHLIHHLTAQRLIPPLPGPRFEPFERPERDMTILQGWGGERNKELGEEGSSKKRQRQSDVGPGSVPPDDEQPRSGGPFMYNDSQMSPFSARHDSSFQPDRPPWTPGLPQTLPQMPGSGPGSGGMHDMPQTPLHGPPHPMFPPLPPMDHRGSLANLPPIRSQSMESVPTMPPSEMDMNRSGPGPGPGSSYNFPYYQQPGPYGQPMNHSHGDRQHMLPPPPPASNNMPNQSLKDRSPVAFNNTPGSIIHSSPSTGRTPGSVNQAMGNWQNQQPAPLTDSQTQNQHPLAGALDDFAEPPKSTTISNAPLIPFESPQMDKQEVYGSADGRETIITKKIIPAAAARTLVDFFHSHISPNLFGYQLQLRAFPYLPEGPTHMTPFILAVESLLASERVPSLYKYHGPLADAVLNMLMTSPAESWQTIQGSREIREAKAKEQVLGKAFDGDTTDWDAELGIGPEEIVAACTLATFIGQKEHARHIAQYAFMWVRGWTVYLKEPGATFAEATGLVTPLRRPSEPDMARVWLLCYVVSGQEILQSPGNDDPTQHDPMRWARVLLPEVRGSSNPSINPHDVLIVFHARLISLLLDWQKGRSEVHRNEGSGISYDPASMSYENKRLASRTNAALDWWAEDLRSFHLDEDWTKQIQLDYLNAKVLVNSVASKSIWGGSEEDKLREGNRAFAVDAAYQLLRRCVRWKPAEAVTYLPQVYLRMIALAASEVVEALTEVENGTFSRTACPVTIREVTPILTSLGNMLFLGGLPPGHGCRTAGHVLRQHVENLNRVSMG